MYPFPLRPLLFALSWQDPEIAHLLAKRVLQNVQKSPYLIEVIERYFDANNNSHPVEVAGIRFPNRVGLAAGFDKHAEMLVALQALGFGFLEVGSILPNPQVGNDRPRMFRFPREKALLNRMGFNSDGMYWARDRLIEQHDRLRVPIGISLGVMKNTPTEQAGLDYFSVLYYLYGAASYLAVNISTPNTAGVRSLQEKEKVHDLVDKLVRTGTLRAKELGVPVRPIFIKLTADLPEQAFADALEGAYSGGASGTIVSNTSVNEALKKSLGTTEAGGVSGRPIFHMALEKVRLAKKLFPHMPVMGVGGVDSSERAQQMFDEGADLVQIFAGFVYQGPKLVSKIRSLG